MTKATAEDYLMISCKSCGAVIVKVFSKVVFPNLGWGGYILDFYKIKLNLIDLFFIICFCLDPVRQLKI